MVRKGRVAAISPALRELPGSPPPPVVWDVAAAGAGSSQRGGASIGFSPPVRLMSREETSRVAVGG